VRIIWEVEERTTETFGAWEKKDKWAEKNVGPWEMRGQPSSLPHIYRRVHYSHQLIKLWRKQPGSVARMALTQWSNKEARG